MRRFPRPSWAMSLLEVLVTMGLLLLVLAMIAMVIRNFASVSAHLDGKDGTQQGGLLLLGIAAEMEEAIALSTPALGTTTPVTEVNLTKFASTSKRLQNATTPATWSPGYVLAVRYYLSGDSLFREVSYPDDAVTTSVVAERLSGFSANRINDRVLEVRATFRESKRLKTVAARAYRWRAE